MRLARFAPLAVLAAASLAACGPGPVVTATVTPTSAAPAPSASPTGPAPVVTPPPAFDPHPPLADMLITTRGLLPLTHTDPIVGNAGEAMLTWDPAYCDAEISGPDDLGRWVAAYPVVPNQGPPFGVDGQYDGIVHRIDIVSPVLHTAEGIHIGSPVSDLVAAYPGLVTGTSGWGTVNVYWISDADGYVVFETDTSMPDGTTGPERVRFIRILEAGVDPDWTVSQSDNFAGGCL